MKILKRNYEVRNLIFFLILSMVYLQAIYSLSRGESLFTLDALKSFFTNHYLIFAITTLTIFMVAKLKKQSDKLLLFCLIVITSKNFIMLASSFNKLILGLNFVYLIFAFYFFITWELEMAKASYNPHFSKRDLEKESRFHLKGQIVNLGTGALADVLITNIDQDGCFVLLSPESFDQMGKGSLYKLTAQYEGVEFSHEANLLSSYDRGLGLEFIKSEELTNNQLDWSELYKVCLQRGLFN
jgi:hypothetical protein